MDDTSNSNRNVGSAVKQQAAKSFSTRIRRKKKDKQMETSQAELATRLRQNNMLELLATVRRSLIEVTKVDMGERFSLRVATDDWQGWPRISLHLVDLHNQNAECPTFQVVAHDRLEKGVLEINPGLEEHRSVFSLADNDGTDYFHLLLKGGIRTYLDYVTEFIIKAEMENEFALAEDFSDFELADEKPKQRAKTKQSHSLDDELPDFDSYGQDGILDTLPSLDDEDNLEL